MQVNGQHHRLTGWPCHLNSHNCVNLGIIKMKQKLKCYRYVATANKIRFHFQFPRSPDAEFGGLIGWLFNWKCKLSCRIISKIANYLKYNNFGDGDGIENVTSRLWKFSYFCSRRTVGVADDDIMFHILVVYLVKWLRQDLKISDLCGLH